MIRYSTLIMSAFALSLLVASSCKSLNEQQVEQEIVKLDAEMVTVLKDICHQQPTAEAALNAAGPMIGAFAAPSEVVAAFGIAQTVVVLDGRICRALHWQ